MVKVLVGDLFQSKAQTLVNTVNCVGVMGKGVALEFKKRFPDMYQDYLARCARKEVKLGRPYLYKSLFPPWILNFPTKDHWRSVSRLDDIVRGLEYLLAQLQRMGDYFAGRTPAGLWSRSTGVACCRSYLIPLFKPVGHSGGALRAARHATGA